MLIQTQARRRRGEIVTYGVGHYQKHMELIARMKARALITLEQMAEAHMFRTVNEVADLFQLTLHELGDLYMSRGYYSWPGRLAPGQYPDTIISPALQLLILMVPHFGIPLELAARNLGTTAKKIHYAIQMCGFDGWPHTPRHIAHIKTHPLVLSNYTIRCLISIHDTRTFDASAHSQSEASQLTETSEAVVMVELTPILHMPNEHDSDLPEICLPKCPYSLPTLRAEPIPPLFPEIGQYLAD